MATVLLVGTLDTKGVEYAFVRDRLAESGCEVIVVDAGVLSDPEYPVDFDRRAVAATVGVDIDELAASGDRGGAVKVMADGAAAITERLCREGKIDGLLGMGGSGGSSIVSRAMSRLPVGMPKLLVSTMASGDVGHYVGASDVTVMYSVVDISGINRVSSRVLGNAAAAISGMAGAYRASTEDREQQTLVGVTMYGATTPCVDRARSVLGDLDYEVLVFHATGTGGMSMEALISEGVIQASLDVTTAEIMAEITGGTFRAGPDRLEAAGRRGIPQVVSVGGADMIAFTPPESLPVVYRDRLLYSHNQFVTLVRTTPEECTEFGRELAGKLNRAKGPVTLFLPLRGTSSYAVPGAVFHDPEADEALAHAVRLHIDRGVELIEMDTDINDPAFAKAMAEKLDQHCRSR
jgi:uncharacterized protein (UPF0261 family)